MTRPFIPAAVVREVLARAAGRCECPECREVFTRGNPAELDHVLPVALGGGSIAGNLQALCRRCHRRKTRAQGPGLAKSRRLSRVGAPPLETEIQAAILDALAKMVPERDGFFWRSQPPPARWREGLRTGMALHPTEIGQPDICGCWRGRFIALEIKRPGGHLRPSQKAFADRIIAAGGIYTIARSVEEAIDLIMTLPETLGEGR